MSQHAETATEQTSATSLAILLYVAHNVAATLCSLLAGQLSDRIGAPPDDQRMSR